MSDMLRHMSAEDMRALLFWMQAAIIVVLALILAVDVLKWTTERQKLRAQEETLEVTRDLLRVNQLVNDDTRRKVEKVASVANEVKQAVKLVADAPSAVSMPAVVVVPPDKGGKP